MRRICNDCLRSWKSRTKLKRIRKIRKAAKAATGRMPPMTDFYPEHVYHDGPSQFCERHRSYRNALGGARRAAENQATPPWADKKAIRRVYERAAKIERETGTKMHVDHIVPLKGRAVTGLHVAENLQVLPARDNIRKSNRFNVTPSAVMEPASAREGRAADAERNEVG